MSLITLFSAPKAFTDPDISRLQRNAIGSWARLPGVDVILLGDEQGIRSTARELGVRHVSGVALNPNGVPLISSMFRLARENGQSPYVCIINTDIVLTSDFVRAAQALDALHSSAALNTGFVLLSRRWDLDVPQPIEFNPGWEDRLRQAAHDRGQLHRPTGSDFFLFPRGCYSAVPDFAIGRAGWDNWMIYHARQQGWSVIDGTPSMFIVHQNHDYRHLPGARPHYNHPDTQVNTRLAGGQAAIRYTILDATHELVDGRLVRPRLTSARVSRRLELFLRRLLSFLPESTLENVVRPKRWGKRLRRLFGKDVS